MTSVRLAGDTAEMRRLADKLRRAGQDNAISDAILAAIRQEIQPLRDSARQRARETLPRRGGLADRVAQQPMPVSYSPSRSRGVRVRIDVRPAHGRAGVEDPAAVDRGRVRHPTFGRTGPGEWHTQQVQAGWFTVPMTQGAPKIRAALVAALNREIDKLQH